MDNSFVVTRTQLIYVLCLPLAVLLGYFIAEPLDSGTVAVVVVVLSVLLTPLLMRWYHPLLLFSWNAAIAPAFLPGQMSLWMFCAALGLGIAILNRIANPEFRFQWVQSINWPIFAILAVVLGTAFLNGGIGSRIFGSSHYGGKGYFCIFAAICGYFALTSLRIPPNRVGLCLALFFLAGFTGFIPTLAYLGGHHFNFIYYIFPPGSVMEQAIADYSLNSDFYRVGGVLASATGFYCWILARYGLRGLFESGKPWRFLLLVIAAGLCLYSGFRTALLMFVMTLAVQFVLEGLIRRPRYVIGAVLGTILTLAVMLPNAHRLPLAVQRTISFLPVEINYDVKRQAQGSAEWRFEIWRNVLPEVPRHLLLGKGYNIDPTVIESGNGGVAEASGDYHSGPLSLIIPFGIWGVLAFGWFLLACLKYLYRSYRYGDPALRLVNTTLLASFVVHIITYIFIFGGFYSDLYGFIGVIGLSVSLNGTKPHPRVSTIEEQSWTRIDAEQVEAG